MTEPAAPFPSSSPTLLHRVEALRAALVDADDRRQTALAWMERVVAERDVVLGELGQPQGVGALRLVAEADLTVDLFAWAPGIRVPAHEHLMWVVLGSLRGCERNTLYRRDGEGLVRSHDVEVPEGSVRWLGDDAIHDLGNAHDQWCVALHVYGGAIDEVPRLVWDMDRSRSMPMDPRINRWAAAQINRLEQLDEAPFTLAAGQRVMDQMRELMSQHLATR